MTARLGCAMAAAAALLLASPSVRAGDDAGILLGYGYIQQSRLGLESQGHLFSLGIHSGSEALEDELFSSMTFDFVIDHTYEDLTQLGMTFQFGYALGGSHFGVYFAGDMRSSIDGYSGGDTLDDAKSSWSPFDPGVSTGLVALLDGYAIGIEGHGWLGWNIYEGFEMEIEPYFDARLYMSLLF